MQQVDRRAIAKLAAYYRRNGYIRKINPVRRRAEGDDYKKGDEVRLVAESYQELLLIRRLLKRVDFRPGRPFRKANQWRLPLYGVRTVKRFLSLIGEKPIRRKRTWTPPPRKRRKQSARRRTVSRARQKPRARRRTRR